MKYGFNLTTRGPLATPEGLAALTSHGEDLGYDAVFVGDHILVPRNIASPYPNTEGGEFPGTPTGASLEQLTLLSFLAGRTRTIRLVTGVLIVPHRNPLVAAKALATMDVLSEGRLVVGVGVGWMREEFETLGLPSIEERGAVTDEYIRAFKELWTSENPTFEGKYCRFGDIGFQPKPMQKPHPPIWVGGESRPALRRAAELGNGWYPLASNPAFPLATPEQLAAALERLGSHARRDGRDPAEIEVSYRTHMFELEGNGGSRAFSDGERPPLVGSAEQIASGIRRYEDMGVSRLVFDFVRQTEDVDEVLKRMEEFATQVWPRV